MARSIPHCGWLGGAVEYFYREPSQPTAMEVFDRFTSVDQQRFVEQKRFASTANLFTSRPVFEEVGLFDSDLRSGGDAKWGNRVADTGLAVRYCPAVIVRHPARRTLSEQLRKAARLQGGMHAYERQRLTLWRALWGILYHFTVSPVLLWRRTAAHSPKLSPLKRMRVVALLLLLNIYKVFTRVYLFLGGSPRR